MALNVTHLKTRHTTAVEGGKLVLHIASPSCDVFSRELASNIISANGRPMTSAELVARDSDWLKLLREPDTLIAMRAIELYFKDHPNKGYQITYHSALYQHQRPIYSLEKGPQETLDRIHSLGKKWIGIHREACAQLLRGHTNEALKLAKICYPFATQVRDGRDRLIAENLSKAENDIKENFPGFKRKDDINLVMYLGIAHRPERYATIPITPVDLVGPVTNGWEILTLRVRNQSPAEYSNRDLLALLVCDLARGGLIPPVPDNVALNADFVRLEEMVIKGIGAKRQSTGMYTINMIPGVRGPF